MRRLASFFALLAVLGVSHLAFAQTDTKHFEPGHFALPTPAARAALSIDQRELTVEHGRVQLRLWVHNPSRRDVQTSMHMPLVGTAATDSPARLRADFQENYAALSIEHDGTAKRYRTSTRERDGRTTLDVVWNATFPAHQTVELTVEYPFLYERHEVGQRESWSFAVQSAASNAWSGRIHYNRFTFCDPTIVKRIGDFGGDTRAWNASYPEYYRDYEFVIRPSRFRLDRYGKCMIWETENRSANGSSGDFEVAMTKRWEKLTPMVPPGVEDEQAFLVRSWCAGGTSTAAPTWNREHLAAALEIGGRELNESWMGDAVRAALARAHGGATSDQLDAYWTDLPEHIRHTARIRLLEYARAYLGKRADKPVGSDFARACTGNVDSSVAPDAMTVENLERVKTLLEQERSAFESAWRAIEEKY